MVTFSSFRHAFRGLKYVMSAERNAKIHLALAVAALIASIALQISLEQWLFVIILKEDWLKKQKHLVCL